MREWPGHAARASQPAASGARRYLPTIGISFAAALFFALSGIFDTADQPLTLRLSYWAILMIIGNLVAIVALRPLERSARLGGHPVVRWIVSTLLMTPFTVVVWLVNGVIFGNRFEAGDMLPIVPNVLLISAALTAINLLVDRGPVETPAAAERSTGKRLIERLPFRLRGAAIRALQAENHYLRVHTDAGTALILMRLSEAIDDLAGLEGARTHRSWWVAREAITGARRHDGRAVLELVGGLEVPVSRSFSRALREEGWF